VTIPSALPKITDRLTLGRSSLRVSPFCQGMTGDDQAGLVPALFDRGVNFFFVSADLHWPMYDSVRRGLADLLRRGGGVRDDLVVAACAYASRAGFMWAAFREALDAVPGLQRLDVLVGGGAAPDDFVPRLQTLERLLARKHCGAQAIGMSFHDRGAAAIAHRHALLDIVYARYNAAHPGAQRDLFPLLDDRSPTLLYNFKSTGGHVQDVDRLGLGDDMWRPRLVDHYRYALGAPHMDGLLGALGEPAHIGELESALAEGKLDADQENYLVNLWRLSTGEVELDADASEPEA
jgi:hypothetical protein